MKLEAGKEIDRKGVFDWLNKVYITPSLSYSEYTDNEIKIFAHDALILLEEQKTVAVHDPGAYCPKCGWMLYPEDHPHYCGNCGQEVKWT